MGDMHVRTPELGGVAEQERAGVAPSECPTGAQRWRKAPSGHWQFSWPRLYVLSKGPSWDLLRDTP